VESVGIAWLRKGYGDLAAYSQFSAFSEALWSAYRVFEARQCRCSLSFANDLTQSCHCPGTECLSAAAEK